MTGGLPTVFGRDWAQRILKVFVDSIAVNRLLANMIIVRGKTQR